MEVLRKIYFDIPYSKKEKAKEYGCWWNPEKEKWYSLETNKGKCNIDKCLKEFNNPHTIDENGKILKYKKQTRLCQRCGRPLVAIGIARKNGRPHHDWNSREYHKECFKAEMDEQYLKHIQQTHLKK